MSHTKHTPGPWRLAGPQGWSVAAANNNVVAHCTTLQWETHDATANARLIAAAPELLAFAQYVLKSGACQGIPGLEGAAHQVISKALGGPSEPSQERAEFVRKESGVPLVTADTFKDVIEAIVSNAAKKATGGAE